MAAHLEKVFPAFASLIVVRRGHIIYESDHEQAKTGPLSHFVEGVFKGAARLAGSPLAAFEDRIGDAWNMRAVTKSVISLLAGIAFKKGLLNSLEDRAFDYLPETRSMRLPKAKGEITLRHLLSMSSGLRPIDTGAAPLRLLLSRNWLRTCLRLPLRDRPGTRLRDSSAGTHLLSAILARVSGLQTADFAQRYLFDPLGISPAQWEADPQGVSFGSGNLFLTLPDMARIGYLVLNNGYWESDTILPDWYMQESLRKQQSIGMGAAYGFLWYLRDETWQDIKIQVISASGTGGQRIFIVPALDLVAAVVCRTNFAVDRSYLINQAFVDYLLPAVS
jgi:CubicO group peptidase (beta-lactamase class C family)